MRLVPVLCMVAACGGTPRSSIPDLPPTAPAAAAHEQAIAEIVKPMIDADIATGIVVGVYDAGKTEVYGFGKGPDGKPPTATTLFEIGSITKVYTSLLLADSIQRREVTLDTHVSDLLPPGVTMPTMDGKAITLGHLALHTSGLPRLPPSIALRPADIKDPYAGYGEEALYGDLVQTALVGAPGTRVLYSNYGAGLLGFALGRKLGGGYTTVLQNRVLTPLALANTFFTAPAAAHARLATGTDVDLHPVPPWTFDALAGAGALLSDATDQLALIDAELDAASGSRQPLRAAMRLTQESQLEPDASENEGLGWQIDSAGRYWHNGGTGGFHAFVGFDTKTRRGVVVLASTSVSLVDKIANDLYKVLAKESFTPTKFPTADQIAPIAGTYKFGDVSLQIAVKDGRVTILGPGEPPYRLIPLTDHELWFEAKQTVVVFEKENDKIARAVFVIGNQRLAAERVN